HVAVGEQELEILGIEADALDRLGRAEADVVLAAVDEVLHLDLHVGAALAGLGVLDLHGAPDAAFIFDDVAGTDVHAADLHVCLSGESGKEPAGALAAPRAHFNVMPDLIRHPPSKAVKGRWIPGRAR